jgi:amino acid adenylation domain-containing protein
VDRHGILRTRFVWEGLAEPLQVVERAVDLPWEEHDWRDQGRDEQEEGFRALLEADRKQGFEVSRAPLMRLKLIRTGETSHRLVWSFHHVLLDGWSLPLVFKEVLGLYQAFARGRELALGPPHRYRDYIGWLSEQDLAKAEGYWRDELSGFGAPTALGVDRGAEGTPEGLEVSEQSVPLSPAATAGLKGLGRRHQITLGTMVQGAWGLLLSRYSGERDVVFGVTVSGRPAGLEGVESMVGLFINTLPMRVRVERERPLLDWLKALQAQQVEQRQYEYSPLVQVQGWSELPGGQPLFETLLAFENYPVDASGLRDRSGNLQIRTSPIAERTNYPLTVIATPGPALSLQIVYDRRRFEDGTITRMLGHLTTLLETMAARPEAALSQLSLLSEPERRQVVVEWNATERDYPAGTIPGLFEAQVERTPEAVAVIFEDQALSYRELNRRANQLAHHLKGLRVGPEVRVGICVERSFEMVVGLLGILKAGGAYVPLDPNYPRERLSFMAHDAALPILLTQERLLEPLPEHRAEVVCLDRDWERIVRESDGNPPVAASPDQAAYVIYTSGSTGQPKGVVGLHRGTINRFEWMWRTYPFAPGEICCQKTTLSFGDAVWEVFGPLLQGVPTLMIPDDLVKDPPRLIDTLSAGGVTRIVLVPSLLRALLESERDLQERLPRLRYWVTSGEALSAELGRRFAETLPRATLLNLYGSSEVAADATFHRVHEPRARVPIGRPIANMRAYVVDGDLDPLPVGVAGELYLGGVGLARGYLGRPGLTAESFLPDPFSAEAGARIYRTGDQARRLADGEIEFLGRVDHQVKVRGFRIELGDVEAALGQYPGVAQTVVAAREDEIGERRLVAYVVTGEGPVSVSELRRFLSDKLPEYMVPAAFVMLEALPLTPSGKVDRRALPAPGATRPELEQAFVPPRGPIEETVASIWAEVLGLERVGVHDDFFELGGHSLNAAQVVSRIRATFDVELALRRLFEARRLGQLAAVIEEALLVQIHSLADEEVERLVKGSESESAVRNEQ